MTLNVSFRSLALFLAAASTACGATTASTDRTPVSAPAPTPAAVAEPTTGPEAAAAVAEQLCRELTDLPFGQLAPRIDEGLASAEAHWCRAPVDDPLIAAIAAGRVRVDRSALVRCLHDAQWRGGVLGDAPCGIEGTIATGGRCTIGAECTSHLCDVGEGCGTCVASLPAGADCEGAAQRCAHPLVCVSTDDGARCRALGSLGEAPPCAADLVARRAPAAEASDPDQLDEQPRLCSPRVALGAACGGAESDQCEPGTECAEDGPSVCVRSPGEGDHCARDVLDGSECATGLECGLRDRRCHERVAAGGACDENRHCAPGTRCVGTPGTCRTVRHAGEACAAEDQCASGLSCAAGTCAPLPDLGEACTASEQGPACFRGACVDGRCAALAIGAECPASSTEALDACGPSASCRPSAYVCVESGAVGAACGDMTFTDCAAGLVCAPSGDGFACAAACP